MKNRLSKVFSTVMILALVLAGLPMQSAQAAGTVDLTTLESAFTQDFDTLASSGTSNTVPLGWDFVESSTNANTLYTAGTGSSNTGDTYSFGASGNSERAFGGLLSGTLVPTIGASFTNDTGSTITDLAISYTGEQWRLGATGREDRLDFQLSTDATSLISGTWTDHNNLDFVAPTTGPTVGLLDGNASANRTAISFTITGLNIADGAMFWIRWLDFNASGADDGLAIDDFSLTPQGSSEPPAPTDPKINEFVANHVSTDTNEYVEIVGDANTDYSDYAILQLEGDTTGSGVIDSVHIVGTTNASGHWYTGFLSNAFENGTVTLLLVKDFSGTVGNDLDTNNDGVFDSAPWSELVDDVAVSDGGEGDFTYSSTVLAAGFSGSPFVPGGASRIPDGTDTNSVDDWMVNDFDLAGIPPFDGTPIVGEAYNTPGALNAVVPPPAPQLVINEIDYDQPSTDTAEFVEIKNNGSSSVSLEGWTLELVNGTGGGAAIYNTITLPAVSLAAGDYFVVCANALTVADCDLDASPNTDFIQNGAPDAVGLRFNGDLMDAVSYEGDTGAPYTEGSGAGLTDTAVGVESISRCPDGADTNQNNVDFVLTGSTPGTTNDCEGADPQLSINDVSLAEGDSGTTTFTFTVSLSAPAGSSGVTFDIATADNTAVSPGDYTAKSLTGQSILAGNSSYTFDVLVNGDMTNEPDETFLVNVTNVTGAVILPMDRDRARLSMMMAPCYFIHAIQGSGSAVCRCWHLHSRSDRGGRLPDPGLGPAARLLHPGRGC
jgi:uncharacterized protein